MNPDPLDRAVEVGAEALNLRGTSIPEDDARIVVEAVAPIFYGEMFQAAEGELVWQIRAEQAESEVRRLELTIDALWATEPWQVADQLATALKQSAGSVPTDKDGNPSGPSVKSLALAAYNEFRWGQK